MSTTHRHTTQARWWRKTVAVLAAGALAAAMTVAFAPAASADGGTNTDPGTGTDDASVRVTFKKVWEGNPPPSDAATLTINDEEVGSSTVGTVDDHGDTLGSITLHEDDSVKGVETFTSGDASNYETSWKCTLNGQTVSSGTATDGDGNTKTGSYNGTIPSLGAAANKTVDCTITNKYTGPNWYYLTVDKVWDGGVDGDTAALTVKHGDTTETSTTSTYDGSGDTETDSGILKTTVFAGESIGGSEKITGNGTYDVNLQCTYTSPNEDKTIDWPSSDGVTKQGQAAGTTVTLASGEKVREDYPSGSTLHCTVTNTLVTVPVEVTKTWVNYGKRTDKATITFSADDSAEQSVTFTAPEGQTKTVYLDPTEAYSITEDAGKHQNPENDDKYADNLLTHTETTWQCGDDDSGELTLSTSEKFLSGGTFTPSSSGEACTITNKLVKPIDLNIDKVWESGHDGDAIEFTVTNNGRLDQKLTDTDTFHDGEIGDHHTIVDGMKIRPGDIITGVEAFSSGDAANYAAPTLVCTPEFDTPLSDYKPNPHDVTEEDLAHTIELTRDGDKAMFRQIMYWSGNPDNHLTAMNCILTNALVQQEGGTLLNVYKTWVDAPDDDSATIKVMTGTGDGTATADGTSNSSTSGRDHVITDPRFVGNSISFKETGGDGTDLANDYDVSVQCSVNGNERQEITGSFDGDTWYGSGDLELGDGARAVDCYVTNKHIGEESGGTGSDGGQNPGGTPPPADNPDEPGDNPDEAGDNPDTAGSDSDNPDESDDAIEVLGESEDTGDTENIEVLGESAEAQPADQLASTGVPAYVLMLIALELLGGGVALMRLTTRRRRPLDR